MRRVALVRRRDGEIVPFDETFVLESVHRALLAAGREDRMLAGEIASVVSLFLQKTFYDEVPTVEQVEDMVEKVLIETGHAAAAKAFILQRDRETRLREAHSVRAEVPGPTLFDAGAIVVDDPVRGTSGAYSREALARSLAADGLVDRRVADEVAAAVEQRLRRASVGRAPSALVRAVAETELLDRGVAVELRRRLGALLDGADLATAFLRRGSGDAAPLPSEAAREIGGAALRAHALSDWLPSAAARAHLDGEIHIHGLEQGAALFAASMSPEHVKRGVAPGVGTRSAEDAALTPRRLSAALGRSLRLLASASSGRAALGGVGVAYAPLLLDAARDVREEEAWHLLFATAADGAGTRTELDLTPVVPDAMADTPALDGRGEPLPIPAGELSGVATAFAAAVLRLHARGSGLPPRDVLPVPVVGVSERALRGNGARDVLRLAAEAALRGERVVFVLARDGAAQRGTSAARGAAGGAGAVPASACAGRVTLNLPRAARRAGRGNVEGFLRGCDETVARAVDVHRTRREVLAHVAAASGGSLSPLFRSRGGREPFLSLAATPWSIGFSGLNEALLALTGFELHEGDEATVRAAQRIVSYLAIRVRAAGAEADLPLTLDADEDTSAAKRFYDADLRAEPERVTSTLAAPVYTPGVGVRRDAPVDPLLRIDREEPLHVHLATATLRLPVAARDAGGPDGVLALLSKCLRAGRARQVEVLAW